MPERIPAKTQCGREPLMKARSLIAILFLLFLNAGAKAQGKPDRFKTQLEPVIKQVMEQTSMPGFAIAVVENQRIVYSAGFGVKNLNTKEPISASALFHMASITKPFVATSLMQLWEQGKIDLDSPVVNYLPYFRL